MSKVYFTSDLHFGHTNLCKNIREMSPEFSDHLLITNWNQIVSKRDIVYVLGDITMDNPHLYDILSKLNGTIYIIGGNHDGRKCCKKLQELGITVLGCLDYKGFICTHIPIHPNEVKEYRGNIHGHIHKIYHGNPSTINELGEDYYNVNCELHNYTPVDVDQIIQYFNKRRISKILQYLSDKGWSDLIDSRWKDDVIKEIKSGFPRCDEIVINEVLKIVLV